YLSVSFVSNYNVSYAEKLTPAADVSEQISTAGTEASGTGNMKFMLNGAVTLGTFDGANVEIVEQAGEENNYIFGARVEDLEKIKGSYNPRKIYDENPRIKKVLDTLVDGTFDDGGTGMFRDLYSSLLDGAHWHQPDHYYILLDLIPYCDAKLRCNADYSDRKAFAKKCFMNMANSGKFSSDRTIKEYASEIWGV
ncbi:MAG: glycogen/starch/alpha-glucan phosphorylase, partial [Ruminococcus sp.]|nr:glycogen/starch/alpha-glucan phosphorylase [Ruminococcus sp.]